MPPPSEPFSPAFSGLLIIVKTHRLSEFIPLSILDVSPLDPFRIGKLQHPPLNGCLSDSMLLIGTIHGSTMEQTRDLERVSPGLRRCEGKPQPLSVRVRLFIAFIHQCRRFPMGSC